MNRLACFCLAASAAAPPALGASDRLTAIVSDLHLDERDRDAGQQQALSALLSELSVRPEAVDLVLAGDVFELATCEDACGEKLDRILDVHEPFVATLSDWLGGEGNRAVFVAGDRDAALLEPGVLARLRNRVNVEIAPDGVFVSGDGRIAVEHGHERGSPVASEAASLFERLEAEFPVIDHFATRLAALKYGLSVAVAETPSAELLKLLLGHVSWQQFRRDLELEVAPPEWDLPAVRALGDRFLIASIPEDDPLHEVVRRAVENERLEARDLTDSEVRLLCDYRAAVRRARRRMERGLTQLVRVGPVVAECPRAEGSRDPSFSYFWSSRDARYRARLDELSKRLPRTPDAYVHGHTHLADGGFVPGAQGDAPLILDAGAFRRGLTPARFEAMRRDRGAAIVDMLASLTVHDLPACYSFVLVEPYDEAPQPRLWFWSPGGDGELGMTRRCEE